MLSVEYDTPMHLYDISQNKLIELEENATKSISQDVPERSFKKTVLGHSGEPEDWTSRNARLF